MKLLYLLTSCLLTTSLFSSIRCSDIVHTATPIKITTTDYKPTLSHTRYYNTQDSLRGIRSLGLGTAAGSLAVSCGIEIATNIGRKGPLETALITGVTVALGAISASYLYDGFTLLSW